MTTLRTPLCELLNIEVPIIQAPMASTSTPDLAVAVSEAGGLGSLGHAYTQPDAMRAEAAAVRARTTRPFNVNLFAAPQPVEPPKPAVIQPVGETISIDDFGRIDLRIARIVDAELVADADKLLKLTLDIGLEQRTVFAGIRSAYTPKELIGRLTVMVANLAPRKMRFGESQGMVLAAGDGSSIYLLAPDSGGQPGMRIK